LTFALFPVWFCYPGVVSPVVRLSRTRLRNILEPCCFGYLSGCTVSMWWRLRGCSGWVNTNLHGQNCLRDFWTFLARVDGWPRHDLICGLICISHSTSATPIQQTLHAPINRRSVLFFVRFGVFAECFWKHHFEAFFLYITITWWVFERHLKNCRFLRFKCR